MPALLVPDGEVPAERVEQVVDEVVCTATAGTPLLGRGSPTPTERRATVVP